MSEESTIQTGEKSWNPVDIDESDYLTFENVESNFAIPEKSANTHKYMPDKYSGTGRLVDAMVNHNVYDDDSEGSMVILSIMLTVILGFLILFFSFILGADSITTIILMLLWCASIYWISMLDLLYFNEREKSLVFLWVLSVFLWDGVISFAFGVVALIALAYIENVRDDRFLSESQRHNVFKMDPLLHNETNVVNNLPKSGDIFGDVVYAGVGNVPNQRLTDTTSSFTQLVDTVESDRNVVQRICTSELEDSLNKLQNLSVDEKDIHIDDLPETTETSVTIRDGSIELLNTDSDERAFTYVKSYGVSTIGGRSKVPINKALSHIQSENEEITETDITYNEDVPLLNLDLSKNVFEPDSDLIYEQAVLELVTEVTSDDLPVGTKIHVRTPDGGFEAKYEINEEIRDLITSDNPLGLDLVATVSKNLELSAKARGDKSLKVLENKLKERPIKNLEVAESRGTLFIDFSFDPHVVPSEEHTLVDEFDTEFFARCVTYVPYVAQFVGANCIAQDILYRGITRSGDIIIKTSLSGETVDACRSNMWKEDNYIDEIGDSVENYQYEYETEEQKRERLFKKLQSETYHHIVVNRIIPAEDSVEVIYTSKNAIGRTDNENYAWDDMDPISIPTLPDDIAGQVVISDITQLASIVEAELDAQWDLDEIKFVKTIEDIEKSYTYTVDPNWIREWTDTDEKEDEGLKLISKIIKTFRPI